MTIVIPTPANQLPHTMPTNSNLPGVNVLLEGPSGTGKTYSIGTFVDACPDWQFFYLALEPGMESLLGYWVDAGKPIPPNLHWHYLRPPAIGFENLIENATKINTMSLDVLSKWQDPNRSKHTQFIELLGVLNNFTDQRTGEVFGPVDSWGTDKVLIMDPLTGMNHIAMSLIVGGKPVKSQSDWGQAMDQIEKLLRQLTDGCRCHFVLTAHIERETDQVLGGSKITVSTLGAKLAPKIPPMFSDVILTKRDGKDWWWDTANPQADLKSRNLPSAEKIKPDFGQIVQKWKSRNSAGLADLSGVSVAFDLARR